MKTDSLTSRLMLSAMIVGASGLIAAGAAEAGERSVRVQGARTGATVTQQAERTQGAASMTRSTQGDLGRGATTTREATWDVTVTAPSGEQKSRTTTVTSVPAAESAPAE